jgi:transposase
MMHVHPTFRRFVGCDVGKSTLVIFESGATRSIANRRAAIEAFAATLDPECLVVCEATGGHETLLLEVLCLAGIASHRADARKVKAFIRSLGVLGKSDAIDARQLALYAAERHARLPLWQAASQNQQKLQTLVLLRQDMVSSRVAWSNRLKAPGSEPAKAHISMILACIEAQVTAVEAEIRDLVMASEQLRQAGRVLTSIPGVGSTTATTLLALMPELGSLDRRQAAALAGVAPHPRQSGTSDAYRRTRGGRPLVKRALFMAALSASRNNPHIKLTYQRLVSAGKKPIVALTAVMRKLIVIANAKLRDATKSAPAIN